MDLATTYTTALLALSVMALAIVVQSFLSGLYKNAIDAQPVGTIVSGNIENRTFRLVRAHLNSVENASAFFAASLLAMIAGANVQWVTYLVVTSVVLRLLHWIFYVFRIGEKIGPSLRTLSYVLGLILNIIIALLAITTLMQL